jgi:VanZ family protein
VEQVTCREAYTVSADKEEKHHVVLIDYGAKKNLRYTISLGICFLYAISDELHQAFIPGRNGNPIDVLIDTAGAAFGLLIIIVFFKLTKKTR